MALFWLTYPLFRTLAFIYRLKFTGGNNCPGKGPVIVVSNHISVKDPAAIALAIKRPVRFMAKKELFEKGASCFERSMATAFGAFPVDRDNLDTEAFRNGLDLLGKGHVVGIFPEGTRHDDKILHSFEPGAAYFAWKAKVPVLPVGISKKECGEYNIVVGKPFLLPEKKGRPGKLALEYTDEIRSRVHALLPADWIKTDT